ncbi:protein arginine N-methyltransferase 9-like [Amyelois transitella]|uniref:protein arginine N-methyltransferase 9-like n=1 Tax=Amyelois transitella TaxID=680683 RepID=UPI00067E1CAB|nr:protein arginine N-methyltransferase 9-like [Amyelois transitella]
MEDIAKEYIKYARYLSTNGCYSKAFDTYMLAFDKNRALKPLFEVEFRANFIRLNEVLATANKMEEIFCYFTRAIDAFPDNIHLLNDIGKYLYKFAFYTEAWCHFQKALRINYTYVNAEKNLNSVKNLLMERWHFRMLNDKVRNEAYRKAIKAKAVPFRDNVLDVGTGSGLLSLYVCECSPKSVTACDGSNVMTSIAESVIMHNKRSEIAIINKMSTALTPNDLGGKGTLLVTEMFDAGLFGEHVLQALAHAWDNLMIDNARIVPGKAEFFVAPAKCDHLNRKYQLCHSSKVLLNIPNEHVHIIPFEETYDCEDIHQIKDIKYMADPKSLLQVDFNDHEDIMDILNGKDPYRVKFKAKEDGEINTLIGWFHLYLTDIITITTNPNAKNRANAWQQAVFFDNIPTPVKKDQVTTFDFHVNGGKLKMLPNTKKEIMRISAETLRFLNDIELVKLITGSIAMNCVYLGQIADITLTNIVDLCPFPLFGLLMLKRGAQSLICCAKTEVDSSFFENIFLINKVPLSKVTILVGEEWGPEVFRDEKYHAIFTNILDLWGDVDLRHRHMAQQLRQNNLMQGGLFMPADTKLVGQLVNSHWLDINNRVYDENVHNYKIAQHVNKYQVTQNFCIDFSHLEYTPVSEPTVLGSFNDESGTNIFTIPLTANGPINAILCWYQLEIMENLTEISTNRRNSFIDGIVFLVNPKLEIIKGQTVKVLRCMDEEGAYKLIVKEDEEVNR